MQIAQKSAAVRNPDRSFRKVHHRNLKPAQAQPVFAQMGRGWRLETGGLIHVRNLAALALRNRDFKDPVPFVDQE
jgi:hypothetical protein